MAQRVLFISQEVTPYLPETEISTISRFLPQGIQERGKEIRTFMPRYGSVNERRNQLHEVIRLSGMNLIIDDNDHPLIIKVASIQSARMQVYFIDNDDYFQRKRLFDDENGVEFKDNDERSIFFVRGVLETVKKLRWIPDVVHCHGWFSALAALYIKRAYADDPCFSNTKIVISVYDNDFKTPFGDNFSNLVKMDGIVDNDLVSVEGKEISCEDLYKFTIEFADGVIQGSKEVNPSVIDFARERGIPVLDYQGSEDYMDKFNEFYDIVWEKASEK